MTVALHDLVYLVAPLPALVVARRYRGLPPLVPLSLHPGGVPVARAPRWLILAPALIVGLVLPLAALGLRLAAGADSPVTIALLQLLLVELALFVALVLALDLEVAAGALRRVPVFVPYAAGAVLLATSILTVVQSA